MERIESKANEHKATAHFILREKGGVGKSYVSTVLAQCFLYRAKRTQRVDIDPVDATFGHERLAAYRLNILRRGTALRSTGGTYSSTRS